MVGFASLWILGLALILTALSFADYRAKMEARRLWVVLKEPGYQAAVYAGLALFSLGRLGSDRAWWETALWGLLAVAFLAYSAASLRALRPRKEE